MVFKSFIYGKYAEYFAVLLLIIKGYKIICTRYKNSFGEIDIICQKKHLIVFVEVKARSNFKHYEVISFKQKGRITRAAQMFIKAKSQFSSYHCRFDVIFVKNLLHIQHIKNYW